MEKTKVMMFKIKLSAILLFLFVKTGCSQTKSSFENANEFYNSYSDTPKGNFKGWEIYPRSNDNNNYVVFDYLNNKELNRFLVRSEQGRYFVKGVFPKDDRFVLMEDYPASRLTEIGISKEVFQLNVKSFFHLKVNKILYKEKFDGLIFEGNGFTVINLFSLKSQNEIPKKYVFLKEKWYYYKE